MFARLLARAAVENQGATLSVLLSVLVAAAATSAMLNLFVDSTAKLEEEFRRFGANLVVEGNNGRSFSPRELETIHALAGRGALAVAFAYAVARTEQDQPIVVAGVEFASVARLNPWWSVSGWPRARGEALIGARAHAIVAPHNEVFALSHGRRRIELSPAGVVKTGAGEDSRVYVSLDDFESWTGLAPSVVEIAAYRSPEQVNALRSQLEKALPDADARVVRQITEGDARILAKTRSTLLAAAIFIVSTAALSIAATLMGWAFDRRRDFAIMKALGGSDRLIACLLAAQAAMLASLGAILGFAAGVVLAIWIGRTNFHASVEPRLLLFPPILAASIAVALIASLLPLRLLSRIEPAMILRGE